MGAFGSCLGVGRPIKSDGNSHFLPPVSVNASPFGPATSSARPMMHRPNSYLTHAALPPNNRGPSLRQSSALSNGTNSHIPGAPPFSHSSPSSQAVPKLVDIDDTVPTQNSHLVCNRDGVNEFIQDLRSSPADCRILVACYDYEPRTHEDLGFRKGEILETTVKWMTGDWWFARSKSTKKLGYVPSNYVAESKSLESEEWYFGALGRAEAEARLRAPENKDGSFIIRSSDTHGPTQFSLSLKHGTEVKHYRIVYDRHGGQFFINKKMPFRNISELVLHYSNAADGLCIKLQEPCQGLPPETAGLSYDTHDRYEIDRNQLQLLKELGHGQFGHVYEGLFNGVKRVAIKTLRKGTMDPQDFLAEAQIMKRMQHPNLVSLFAVCTQEEPVYIVTELMCKGALINYLQTNEGKNLDLKKYINMARQIASGMKYLEKEKYVHRDLAARNILVGENNICKIADFGLARFIKETEYEARAGARFPIKWTAPEAANFSKFTIKSDVWSFGIVLYEIITKGGTPYPGMTNAEVLTKIDRGYRMSQPPNCEDKYFKIMMNCWKKDANQRPTFETLESDFENYFVSDEQYRDASHFREN